MVGVFNDSFMSVHEYYIYFVFLSPVVVVDILYILIFMTEHAKVTLRQIKEVELPGLQLYILIYIYIYVYLTSKLIMSLFLHA